jgi:cytochrome c553
MRSVREWILPLVTLAPLVALAASAARQEYLDAVRARPNLEHGAQLFENCAICHGSSGGGVEDGSVPRIAGQHREVLIKQLVDYRHDKRWDIRMERYSDKHLLADAQAIADVTGYISQLDRRTPRGVGPGDLVKHGESVYADRCVSCHGRKAEGDAHDVVPRLAGQHYEYVLRQMYDAVDGRRPNFSSSHVRLLAKLERDDLVGVADYLSRLDWPQQTGGAGQPP